MTGALVSHFACIQTLNLLACVTKVMDANLFLFVGPEDGILKQRRMWNGLLSLYPPTLPCSILSPWKPYGEYCLW